MTEEEAKELYETLTEGITKLYTQAKAEAERSARGEEGSVYAEDAFYSLSSKLSEKGILAALYAADDYMKNLDKYSQNTRSEVIFNVGKVM